MDRGTELRVIRRAYAKQILASVGIANPAIEDAFATVRREDFVGPGPWQVFRPWGQYVPTPDADPVYLYTDNLVGLIPERRINNGQPSLHAYLLAAAAPRQGEHIVHVGTGSGYYTAIMAELVGNSGRVTGIEFDPELAAQARTNLASYANVEIVEGDGALVPFDAAQMIYINAGATRPAKAWLDGLADGGRLILPLTTDAGFGKIEAERMAQRGAIFRIDRQGQDYSAKWISPVAIFPCAGNRDAASEKALAAALEKGGMRDVTRLYRGEFVNKADCWLRGADWCLAYR